MRVLLVDDNEAVRKMLRRILERKTSFDVVGEASSGAEASRSWLPWDPTS